MEDLNQKKELQNKDQLNLQKQDERESAFKKLYKDYVNQKQNEINLYSIFKNNVLLEDFTYSRRSALAFIFVPTLLNLYYIWKPYSPMKNTFRIGTIIGCFLHFNYALKKDFRELVKKDTELANKARLYAQNISINNLSVRSFQKETNEIADKRKQKIEPVQVQDIQSK
ncbi:hypothetical protein ABPG72_007190 [Tetrahymena utriculariae]